MEELQLLEEEMRRAIDFCRWKARWWEIRQDLRLNSLAPHVAEGIRAYALEQADVERKRALDWTVKWSKIRTRANDVLETHLCEEVNNVVFEALDIELDDEDELENNTFFEE